MTPVAYVLLVVGLTGLACLGYRSGQLWLDAAQRDLGPGARAAWSLWGALMPDHVWWPIRFEAMSQEEQSRLLESETQALGVERLDSLLCPLCGAEIHNAWALTADGQARVAPGPVQCPSCDFRLDACRHCARFLPGPSRDWGQSAWTGADMTFGRCAHYKKVQSLEQACAPQMAQRLRQRGYDQIRAPAAIMDSYLPLDSCRAFEVDRRRLRANRIAWPNARYQALLSILRPPLVVETPAHDEEQWLL
ncbi:MAG: hypothetical protein PVJ26_03770 [Anaerolineae bacterium]